MTAVLALVLALAAVAAVAWLVGVLAARRRAAVVCAELQALREEFAARRLAAARHRALVQLGEGAEEGHDDQRAG